MVSVLVVVERVVVLIFVEEERKEEGTNTFLEVRRTTFQVNYSPMIFLLTHTQTTII
jgi:hypothetical protein